MAFYSIYNRENAGAEALKHGETQDGVPYEWGGTSPGIGFDCSGLTQWAYASVGVPLARSTFEQFKEDQIGRGEPLLPGDLLFIPGSDGTASNPGHVMFYISPGKILQAPFTGEDVGIYSYDTNVYVFATRPANHYGPTFAGPSAAELKSADLVVLKTALDAVRALKNGWDVRGWTDNGVFIPLPSNGVAVGVVKYANVNFAKPRKK
jgi:hypothetical protein